MKLTLLFPGQGSQQVGMGKLLFDEFVSARQIFERADAALGEKLSDLIFNGPQEQLTQTINAQPAILTVSIAALKVLQDEFGFDYLNKTSYVAGHSLGEYSALVAAKSIDFERAVKLVRFRSIAMQEAVAVGKGAMAAIIGLDPKDIETVIYEASVEGTCDVANDNAKDQIVVSGATEAVEAAIISAKKKFAKRAIKLNVSAPFHSRLMMPAQERMCEKIEEIQINEAQIPVITNFLVKPVTKKKLIIDSLVKQITAKVRWRETMDWLIKHNSYHYIEIGNGKVLTSLAKRRDSKIIVENFAKPSDIDNIKNNLKDIFS